jgi:uncharacterized protein YacL
MVSIIIFDYWVIPCNDVLVVSERKNERRSLLKMEQLNMILDYYHQNKIVFAIVALVIFVLLLFRFKSFLLRLFLIALVLFGTYVFIVHFAGVATKQKKALIQKYFPRDRLQ